MVEFSHKRRFVQAQVIFWKDFMHVLRGIIVILPNFYAVSTELYIFTLKESSFPLVSIIFCNSLPYHTRKPRNWLCCFRKLNCILWWLSCNERLIDISFHWIPIWSSCDSFSYQINWACISFLDRSGDQVWHPLLFGSVPHYNLRSSSFIFPVTRAVSGKYFAPCCHRRSYSKHRFFRDKVWRNESLSHFVTEKAIIIIIIMARGMSAHCQPPIPRPGQLLAISACPSQLHCRYPSTSSSKYRISSVGVSEWAPDLLPQ